MALACPGRCAQLGAARQRSSMAHHRAPVLVRPVRGYARVLSTPPFGATHCRIDGVVGELSCGDRASPPARANCAIRTWVHGHLVGYRRMAAPRRAGLERCRDITEASAAYVIAA